MSFPEPLRYIDLFCGLGGFRVALDQVCQKLILTSQCVFSSDLDEKVQDTYEANFGERPAGDITQVIADEIPNHDLLFAGFPCQPFSIIGDRKGFDDIRGTLFFDIARILQAKHPLAFVLENVKQLQTHDKGRTLAVILETLQDLGYQVDYRVLNALDFGLPQKRERTFIVGFRQDLQVKNFFWSSDHIPMIPLIDILETEVSDFYYASQRIRNNRLESVAQKKSYQQLHIWNNTQDDNSSTPTIWHENKSGNISIHPFACALRAGASYNYLLVNGERRLTEREMLRLQGFPDSYNLVGSYSEARKQIGNSVPVPVVSAVIEAVLNAIKEIS